MPYRRSWRSRRFRERSLSRRTSLQAADLSGLTGVNYTGRGERTLWDYRVLDWITVNAYLFEARIHGRSIEFQVNPEFGSEDAARAEVDTYAPALGRLPAVPAFAS